MPKFEVPIIYIGLSNFIVRADTKEQAEERARAKFNNGDEPIMLGNESESIDHIGEIQEIEIGHCLQCGQELEDNGQCYHGARPITK